MGPRKKLCSPEAPSPTPTADPRPDTTSTSSSMAVCSRRLISRQSPTFGSMPAPPAMVRTACRYRRAGSHRGAGRYPPPWRIAASAPPRALATDDAGGPDLTETPATLARGAPFSAAVAISAETVRDLNVFRFEGSPGVVGCKLQQGGKVLISESSADPLHHDLVNQGSCW